MIALQIGPLPRHLFQPFVQLHASTQPVHQRAGLFHRLGQIFLSPFDQRRFQVRGQFLELQLCRFVIRLGLLPPLALLAHGAGRTLQGGERAVGQIG